MNFGTIISDKWHKALPHLERGRVQTVVVVEWQDRSHSFGDTSVKRSSDIILELLKNLKEIDT